MEIKIIIDNGFWNAPVAKGPPLTPEEIEEIERLKSIQREVDALARKLAFGTPTDGDQESTPQSKP